MSGRFFYWFLVIMTWIILSACAALPSQPAPPSLAAGTHESGVPVSMTASAVLFGAPKVLSITEAEASLKAGVEFLEDLAREKHDPAAFAKPGVVEYFVPLAGDKPVIWVYTWCASNPETLLTNFGNIELKFELDEKEISVDSFAVYETDANGKRCRLVYTSLSEWTAGEHHLVTVATFKTKINDGLADYEPGDYVLDYMVYVRL